MLWFFGVFLFCFFPSVFVLFAFEGSVDTCSSEIFFSAGSSFLVSMSKAFFISIMAFFFFYL